MTSQSGQQTSTTNGFLQDLVSTLLTSHALWKSVPLHLCILR